MSFPRSHRRIGAIGVAIALLLLATRIVRAVLAQPRAQLLSPAVRQSQNAARAMLGTYYMPAIGLMAGHPIAGGDSTPSDPKSYRPAALWGYTWSLAALEDVAQLPGGSRFLPQVRKLADNLSTYWDPSGKVPGYAPTPYPEADAIKFFDDNAWAGLDLIEAYHLTHDSLYLKQAQAVFRYERTGWDPARGGIYWNEERTTRNTTSNAPVAELGVYLYMDTHDEAYLAWAKKIYRWEVSHLVVPATGEAWGSVDKSSQLVRAMWTYNQGTVIGAGVLLYEVTHDPSYLSQAKKTASFVLHHAVRGDGTFVAQAEFNGVLVDNLQLLYGVTDDPAIRRAVATNARLAWSRARDHRGLFGADWSGPPPSGPGPILLTQTGAVRLLAVRAALETGGFGGLRL